MKIKNIQWFLFPRKLSRYRSVREFTIYRGRGSDSSSSRINTQTKRRQHTKPDPPRQAMRYTLYARYKVLHGSEAKKKSWIATKEGKTITFAIL